jgi:hypothetical protein
MITIRNVGFGDLVIQQLDMLGPDGTRTHPSVKEFSVTGCAQFPCTPSSATLCSPSQTGCSNSSMQLTLSYQNMDEDTTDLVQLIISSNDPFDPRHILVIQAEDVPCFYPTPVITVSGMPPYHCNQSIALDGSMSDPGRAPMSSANITNYSWSWVFAASTPPFNPMSGSTPGTNFTPTAQGVYIVGLGVTNSCGAQSQMQATTTIQVMCP